MIEIYYICSGNSSNNALNILFMVSLSELKLGDSFRLIPCSPILWTIIDVNPVQYGSNCYRCKGGKIIAPFNKYISVYPCCNNIF